MTKLTKVSPYTTTRGLDIQEERRLFPGEGCPVVGIHTAKPGSSGEPNREKGQRFAAERRSKGTGSRRTWSAICNPEDLANRLSCPGGWAVGSLALPSPGGSLLAITSRLRPDKLLGCCSQPTSPGCCLTEIVPFGRWSILAGLIIIGSCRPWLSKDKSFGSPIIYPARRVFLIHELVFLALRLMLLIRARNQPLAPSRR